MSYSTLGRGRCKSTQNRPLASNSGLEILAALQRLAAASAPSLQLCTALQAASATTLLSRPHDDQHILDDDLKNIHSHKPCSQIEAFVRRVRAGRAFARAPIESAAARLFSHRRMRGLLLVACAAAFQAPRRRTRSLVRPATCTPAEAQKVVGLAKQAISRDAGVKDALGALQRVENIIGSGSPAPGAVAVSFSASFRRQGNPFKLAFGKEAGTTKVANRGSNVSQIKARADGGKLVSCSIQMDGGWGRTINVRC